MAGRQRPPRSAFSAHRACRSPRCSTGRPTGSRAGMPDLGKPTHFETRGTANTEHSLGPQHLAGCFALSKALPLEPERSRLAADVSTSATAGSFGRQHAHRHDARPAVRRLRLRSAWCSSIPRTAARPRFAAPAPRDRRLRARNLTQRAGAHAGGPRGLPAGRLPGHLDLQALPKIGDRASFPRPLLQGKNGLRPRFRAGSREAFGADRARCARSGCACRRRRCRCRMDSCSAATGVKRGRSDRSSRATRKRRWRCWNRRSLQCRHRSTWMCRTTRPSCSNGCRSNGFALQRPFTRMIHGGARPPGNERLVYRGGAGAGLSD